MNIVSISKWTPTASEDTYISSPIGPLQVDNPREPWSFSSSDNNLMRFEMRRGDVFQSSYWNDPPTVQRDNVQELVSNRHPVSQEAQINYDFMIEPGLPNTARWVVLGSLKGFYSENWSAPFEVAMRGEKLAITANYESSPGNLVYRDIWVSPTNVVRGEWYDIKIDFDWGPSGNGKLNVFLGGKEIVNYHGNVGYYDQTAYLWKTGIYRASVPETMAVDVKNLHMKAGTNLPDFESPPSNTLPALTHLGTSGNDTLNGTSASDVISGGTGNHAINGFGGDDVLIGGSGKDTFVFNTPLGPTNVDTIQNFNLTNDIIDLNDIIFKNIGWDDLAPQYFCTGTAAQTANTHIIYDSSAGALFYDKDGTGPVGQVEFAVIADKAPLAAASFHVI